MEFNLCSAAVTHKDISHLQEAYVKALGKGFSASPFKTFTLRLGDHVKGNIHAPPHMISKVCLALEKFVSTLRYTLLSCSDIIWWYIDFSSGVNCCSMCMCMKLSFSISILNFGRCFVGFFLPLGFYSADRYMILLLSLLMTRRIRLAIGSLDFWS